jgi:alpha-ketoglutaric semialdehyde dehydrogenase
MKKTIVLAALGVLFVGNIIAADPRTGALHCYDNVRAARLPAALQNKNPNGKMWRLIDGNWTQRDVGA